ncbi:MAG TPA: ATP-binding protein [Candidatus Aquilonibacter sp.]|nr:ATP-binding protein [Candidatus Aquilonibacter sp.]
MKVAGLPANERERLEALEKLDLLDTAEESTYDAFTALAREITGTKISLISLVDEHRQWFKSHLGLNVRETPRDQAFCSHVVETGATMVVGDAHQDARFADNPLVTGDPHIRFYAGVPLTTPEGYAIGTLCVLDDVPKALSASQMAMLDQLARTLISVIDGRRRFLTLFDAAHIDVFSADPTDATIMFASRGATARLGYSRHEITGMPLFDLMPTLNVRQMRDIAGRLARGENVVIESMLARKDGSSYPVELRLDYTQENGDQRLLIIAQDLTQRKLQQSEIQLLLTAMNAAGDAIVVFDVIDEGELRIAYINEAYTHQTGYSRDEAIGKTLNFFRQSMPDDEGMRAIRRAIATGVAGEAEIVSYRKDGSTYWNQVTLHPIRDEQGAVTHWISIERDISDEVERTSALAEEHDRLLALTRAARRLFTALDTRTLVATVRDVIAQLIGGDGHVLAVREDYLSVEVDELGAPDWSRATPDELVHQAKRDRARAVDETNMRAVAPAGQFGDARYALEVRARPSHPLRNTDLFVFDLISEYFQVASRNVSLYQELDERRSAVLELNQTKSDLIAMLAHDFRGPLTSIVGFADLTSEVGDTNEEQIEFLDTIKRSALQLSELATDTLTLSRLERNEVALQVAEVDLKVLISSIIAQYADRAKIALDVVGDTRIAADDERLRQVFANLIDNAIKYSPNGAPPSVKIEGGDDDVTISIVDHGIGIPTGELSRVFDRFSRASNARKLRISGTGFGLFLTKQLVALHGGTIAVESEEGRGSTFIVTLPRRVDRRAAPKTIVVVDPHREHSFLGYGLQEAGYRVVTVVALDEVLALADSQSVDALLLADADGLRAADAAQYRAFSRERSIPILAIGGAHVARLSPALTLPRPVLIGDVISGLERLVPTP